MDNSGFINEKLKFRSIEKVASQGETCETFIVNIEGKNYFMKRLRAEFVHDKKYVSSSRRSMRWDARLIRCIFPNM